MQGFSKCLGLFQVIGGKPQLPIIHYMSSGKYFVHQAIGGVFLPRSQFSSPVWFLKAWPRTPLPYRVWVAYFLLTGWLVGGWLLAGWLAGRRAGWPAGSGGWLAGWLGLAGLLVYIIWMAGILMSECGLPVWRAWIWPRFGPRTGPRTICIWYLLIGYINDEDKVPISH